MKCKRCIHAIFDENLGEYKCKKKKRYVKPELLLNCTDYKRKVKSANG